MKAQTITLCMIVKNEERTLERCLLSAKDVVDEIVIVDTGSTDNTIKIAERFTSKIYHFEWTNNFSDARNFAMEKATSDYILSLDADEYFADQESKSMLLQPLTASYYFLRIRNMIRSGIVDTHSFVRLFRRKDGFKYEGAIHEQINFWDFPELEGEAISTYINHDGYNKAIIKSKNKNTRNMDIIKEELKLNPTAFGYFNLGTQYKVVEEYDKAVKAFQRSYSINPNTTFAPKLLVFLIQSLSQLNRYNEALQIASDAALLYPTYTDIKYEIALQYKKLHYWKDAEQVFLDCIEKGEVTDHQFSSLEGVGSYLSHAHLAEIYMTLGFKQQALNHINLSLSQNKMHFASLRIYLELFLNARPQELLDHLKEIYTLDSPEEAGLLIQALYVLRSPILLVISKYIRQEMSAELQALLLQMEGSFEEASVLWKSLPKISDGSQRDILLIAMVTQDLDFFKIYEQKFNLRSKDVTLISRLITRKGIVAAEMSDGFIGYFRNLCFDLLMLRRYEVIEYLLTDLQVPMLRYELSKMLHKFEFTEMALTCIMEPQRASDKDKVYVLTGDVLRDLEMYGDAYAYYKQASITSKKFEGLYKIYDLAERVGDKGIQEEVLATMNKLKPESAWVKQKVQKRTQEAK